MDHAAAAAAFVLPPGLVRMLRARASADVADALDTYQQQCGQPQGAAAANTSSGSGVEDGDGDGGSGRRRRSLLQAATNPTIVITDINAARVSGRAPLQRMHAVFLIGRLLSSNE